MNEDLIVGFIYGVVVTVAVGGLGVAMREESWKEAAIERGCAIYSPKDGKFQWIKEKDENQ